MSIRAIVVVLILSALVFLLAAYGGLFMHGDPIE